ncbi:O-antigen ligase family protein [Candidatus Azambacteria bacterium]|nr:O-antigen ligase family protein [Candidatus Azambacteria bacterium]
MKRYLTKLNIVFAVQLITVAAVVFGGLPREAFLFSAAVAVFFVIFSPLEETVLLIARSIPIFVALPITEQFDSLNMWRIVVLILFLKWLSDAARVRLIIDEPLTLARTLKTNAWVGVVRAWRQWPIEFLSVALIGISFASLVGAEDVGGGVKRIIYFLNLGMLFFVVRSVATRDNIARIALNVTYSGIIVVLVGALQLVLAYTMNVDHFSEFWALTVNTALYGTAWANIAIAANTWFAYYSGTIHLRMFSSFPDTHSFPLYLLMVLCFSAVLFTFEKSTFKKYMLGAVLAFAAFEAVLSGTRGIWASAVFAVLFIGYLIVRRYPVRKEALVPLGLFFISLPLAALIFNSPQFQFSGTPAERAVFSERIRSIVDTQETSNQGRIYIWKETIRSIRAHPLLGVGIGNFPVVLALNPSAIKAGASAHNLYLNFFAELGALGFIATTLLIIVILKKGWDLFMRGSDDYVRFFGLNALIYLIWILWYSMTDVAIFDERAFLLLAILLGVLFACAPSSHAPSANE